MAEVETDFAYLGHHVLVSAQQRGTRWFWSYTVDGALPVVLTDFGLWSYRMAIEEGSMKARDEIRAIPQSLWRRWGKTG